MTENKNGYWQTDRDGNRVFIYYPERESANSDQTNTPCSCEDYPCCGH